MNNKYFMTIRKEFIFFNNTGLYWYTDSSYAFLSTVEAEIFLDDLILLFR